MPRRSRTKIKIPVIIFPQTEVEFKTCAGTHRKSVCEALSGDGCFMATWPLLNGPRDELSKAPNKIFGDLVKASHPDITHKKNDNDQSESIDILDATADKGPDMSNAIKGYIRTAQQLEEKVREIVFGPDKLPKESPGYIFRMMKYTEEASLAFPDHEDRGEFLAVLALNKDNNSEIRANINGQPSSIDVRSSTFLIMAGKPLKDWKEVIIHQDGNKEKYSVGLFSYYDKGKTEAPKKQAGSSRRA